jgi:hypothetical protein
MNIADILGYKSRKDALRDNVDKENKRKLTEIINTQKSVLFNDFGASKLY